MLLSKQYWGQSKINYVIGQRRIHPESVILTSMVEAYNNTVSFQDYSRFLNDELFKLTDIARFLFANNALLALNAVLPAKLSLGSYFPFFYRVV